MEGYYNLTAFTSIIIERVVHNIEEKVVFYIQNNETNEMIGRKRRATVKYTNVGRPYFMYNNTRIYLDECMRVI